MPLSGISDPMDGEGQATTYRRAIARPAGGMAKPAHFEQSGRFTRAHFAPAT